MMRMSVMAGRHTIYEWKSSRKGNQTVHDCSVLSRCCVVKDHFQVGTIGCRGHHAVAKNTATSTTSVTPESSRMPISDNLLCQQFAAAASNKSRGVLATV